jgi:hypothetical protein
MLTLLSVHKKATYFYIVIGKRILTFDIKIYATSQLVTGRIKGNVHLCQIKKRQQRLTIWYHTLINRLNPNKQKNK